MQRRFVVVVFDQRDITLTFSAEKKMHENALKIDLNRI